MAPEHHDTARRLMQRFPGWKIWPGPATRTWWAMAPARLRPTSLLEAATSEGLAAQIAQADQAAPHRPDPHRPPAASGTGPTAMATPAQRLDLHRYPARLARRLLDDALTAWNATQWSDNGRIVVSELVTNAQRHGKPPIFLTLALKTGTNLQRPRLLIEVTDTSPFPPRDREPGDEGGFGMAVLHGLGHITVHLHPGGKTIRAAVHPPPET